MKLQGMSIIFALVIVPIILVLSYYIQLQVDTINLQTAYDTKLLDSTHDAMAAFELNTANEDLSTVSDSLRTIIEASYNVFINNLSTNLGMSNANKSRVEPFIPSVLYTLYDGYYICAPTAVPTVLIDDDGNAIYVGDKGVTGSSDNYRYRADSDELLDATVGLDYGQLLYLKEGSTDVYTTDINKAKLQTKNVLKTYMPYSARYKGSNFDLTMVYTLDNYVTIEGSIGTGGREIYYTKSGYLIPDGSIQINITNPENDYSTNIDDYNQNDIQTVIENRWADFEVVIDGEDGSKITFGKGKNKKDLNSKVNVLNNVLEDTQELWYSAKYNGYTTAADSARNTYVAEYFANLSDNYDLTTVDGSTDWTSVINQINSSNLADVVEGLKNIILAVEAEMRDTKYELDTMSSVVYYAKAYTFSKWVNDYLCTNDISNGKVQIKEDNLIEVAGQKYSTIKGIETLEFDFATGINVFDFTGTEPVSATEIPNDCPFYQHKLSVIRMSIQYNLNLAMSTYNNNESYLFEYEMPVIQASEWEQILSHISITSFMQGWKCGLKTYNNYKIVSSTNNDILTLPEEVYYVKKEDFNNESSEYHRINCDEIINNDTTGQEYIAFSSKEVKYDKIADKTRDFMFYEYDHKNYACYDCINDGNYFNYDSNGNGRMDAQVNIFKKDSGSYEGTYANLRRAYYIGVAKERNDTYKMNAILESQGYEVLRMDDTNGSWLFDETESTLSVSNIKSIEISIGTIYSQNDSIRNAIFSFGYGSADNLSNDTYSIATNNTSNNNTQSIRINIIPGKPVGNGKFNIANFLDKAQCENSDDILKATTDASGNTITTNAIDQLKSTSPRTVKYVRVIYK